MEIKLNYTTEELSVLLDSLNNALISLKRNYSALILGIEDGVPVDLIPLAKDIDINKLQNREKVLIDLYNFLLQYEVR